MARKGVNDAHCHFFSPTFFQVLGKSRLSQLGEPEHPHPAQWALQQLGWEDPISVEELTDRWISEWNRNEVGRVALIASVPADEESVAQAQARYPDRIVGFFMLDPTRADALERTRRAVLERSLRCVCLFPALHHFSPDDERILQLAEIVQSRPGTALFVHCGVLTVGARRRLGFRDHMALDLGNPLRLVRVAAAFPNLPLIVPHFGAGLFREALMLADVYPNVYLDTSSSNRWIRYFPGLTLGEVFRQALEVLGSERLLFGTDSSYFPRGWNREVFEEQLRICQQLQVGSEARRQIFGENFNRIFPLE